MDNSKLLKIKKSIQKKLLGKSLAYEEIYEIIDAIAKKQLDDILLTYFAAASYKEKHSIEELYYLTKAMVETGIKFNFPSPVADKHSTGGVPGNRITLILVPIIASLGITIPKTSSRAITSPAGTADCMEVLAPVELSKDQIEYVVKKTNGCIIWGGHLNIAPADDELIRVEKPLQLEPIDKIIVSILAKKVALSATHLVLDIPYEKTLKIKNLKEAEEIARKFKKLCKLFNIKVKAVITSPKEPPGKAVGPALEALDALLVLERDPERPLKLEEKTKLIAIELLKLIKNLHKNQAKKLVEETLESKKALLKFKEIIKLQGGNTEIDSKALKEKIEKNTITQEIKSKTSGKIKKVIMANLSAIAKILGAPQYKWAGVKLLKRVGEKIEKDQPVLKFYAKDKISLNEAIDTLKAFPIYEIS